MKENRFNIGDEVVIEDTKVQGTVEGVIQHDPSYQIKSRGGFDYTIDESSLCEKDLLDDPIGEYVELKLDTGEYLGELATVATSRKLSLRIQVNPDPHRKGNPYFKVFNTAKLKVGESKVCRLHFMDKGMEFHTDKYIDWKISQNDIKVIKGFLETNHPDIDDHTIWEMTCWKWNLEYGFFDEDDREDYFDGMYDDEYEDHPSYVPSITEIPKTWEYRKIGD